MSKGQVVVHYNYLSVMRVDPAYLPWLKIPEWYNVYTSNQFSHASHVGHNKPTIITVDMESQREMGVLINDSWPHKPMGVGTLAQYCTFPNAKAMTAYIDIIVPDIVHEAALLASNPPSKATNTSAADIEFHEFIETNKFYAIDPHSNEDTDFSKEFFRPSPIKVLQAYCLNKEVRDFVDRIIELCPQPTFLPVRNDHVSEAVDRWWAPKDLHPQAFVLAAAAQILLFAPQDWDPNRVYSRDKDEYVHRFPTPDNIGIVGGTDKVVSNKYSMEDLHRAILMFYRLVERRKEYDWADKKLSTRIPKVEFPGYHDPNKPEN
ncbi:hypothetical protein NXS19_008321 [Fusarium pseudograminearum]|nr:hypothetical protein NXS19_008321 [Fusarium pseudograminearum]